jgi:hypothetical protein
LLFQRIVEGEEDREGGRGARGAEEAEEGLEGEVEEGPDGVFHAQRGEGNEGVCFEKGKEGGRVNVELLEKRK